MWDKKQAHGAMKNTGYRRTLRASGHRLACLLYSRLRRGPLWVWSLSQWLDELRPIFPKEFPPLNSTPRK